MSIDDYIKGRGKIARDHKRFQEIVKGKAREDLRRYLDYPEGIVFNDKGDKIKIPMPRLDLPRFRFKQGEVGGVSYGDGEEGDPLGNNNPRGSGKAGEDSSGFGDYFEITLDEFAEILGEEWELPRLEPKEKGETNEFEKKYRSIRSVGPKSLRDYRRTYKNALRRMVSSGYYNVNDPLVTPIPSDEVYRSWKDVPLPNVKTQTFFIRDVSGSVGPMETVLIQHMCFILQTWITHCYGENNITYIIHNTEAEEVDELRFYGTESSGGTNISSGLNLAGEIIAANYPPQDYNLYLFHFSDGGNTKKDNKNLIKIVEELEPVVNLLGFAQIDNPELAGGSLVDTLYDNFDEDGSLRWEQLSRREQIKYTIQYLLSQNS